ncbi:MAG: carbohydrate binding family 9 domain-containing protein [Bacteroidetes bacterium]|nr:carbohydrate binding family 9 domain-containing protein [Bacteroidota bacterium]
MFTYPKCLFIIPFFFCGFEFEEVSAQEKNKQGIEFTIRKARGTVKLDGIINEPDWTTADIATNFYMNSPVDTMAPYYQSKARVTFDDHFLYVSFVCYDNMEKPNIVQSLRRDFDYDLNDNIGIFIDPYNDHTNGFYFLITPYNVQHEGIVYGGGTSGDSFNNNWDNKWYSHVVRYADKWIAEMAIPFRSFRYNNSVENWNVTFLRHDLKHNQLSSWIATPIQYVPASFAYTGKMKWETQAPRMGQNISLIPYMVGSSSQDAENKVPTNNTMSAGLDAKVAITPALNLDLTINPDFSNVDVDRQVINLTRFEYQYPERRTFFLENSDLFSSPGYPPTRPFFSRRIGLASDSSGNLQKVPIAYGARISGKIGKNWRIGAMNLQTKKKENLGLPDQNYTVAVVQRQIFSRSNIDFFVVNKQSLGMGNYDSAKYYNNDLVRNVWDGTKNTKKLNLYNRVIGADFNLFTKSNRWNGDFYYHKSFDDFSTNNNYSYGGFLSYSTRYFNTFGGQYVVGKNYNAEVGFVPAQSVYNGFINGFNRVEGKIYPKVGSITNMGPGLEFDRTQLLNGTMTDKAFILDYTINYRNTSRLYGTVQRIFSLLPQSFNPIDPHGDVSFQPGQKFEWTEYNVQYNSDSRKVFTYTVKASGGQFYDGQKRGLSGTISYRYQPYGNITVTYDYNDIRMSYGSAKFLLISPRMDLTFTNKLFFTTIVQYNTRYDNMALNARLQWRYKPVSDFFVVYTENYLPEHLVSKNRALVVKWTYWLNL